MQVKRVMLVLRTFCLVFTVLPVREIASTTPALARTGQRHMANQNEPACASGLPPTGTHYPTPNDPYGTVSLITLFLAGRAIYMLLLPIPAVLSLRAV